MGPVQGPSLPPTSALQDLQDSRERAATEQGWERAGKKTEYRKGAKEGREEERDNRATGRERVLEKRKEGAAVNREMRDAKDGGMQEVDDDTLMGSGGGFAAA